ncbi:hypothetical protein [Embleya hyalina]|uniref:Uncharacterized protein n=1 Tax=Embleya hyalina TaxID=516124 RepID=A0A401Z3A5_9ACTN|nr:hypothetical protein [Embleya hyalina]GCE01339.1 hypothetical protein EHYA_09104 [Embleya hyalina]
MSPYDEDRLPGHDRRRRELLAMLDPEQPGRHRALVPGIAAGAVLAICAVGVLAAQPWRGPENLSAAGPVTGQDPSQGVPRESAEAGDPVPWDVAARTLARCLDNGRRAAVPPPPPTGFGTSMPTWRPPEATMSPGGEQSLPPGVSFMEASGPPMTPPAWLGDAMPPTATGRPTGPNPSPPSSGGPAIGSGSLYGPATFPPGVTVDGGPPPPLTASPTAHGARTPSPAGPDASLWKVREPDSAFKPYFTAWEDLGGGMLRPLVVGKATMPGLVVCHGEAPPDFPAPTAADGTLAGPFEVRRSTLLGPVTDPPPAAAVSTWWGRTTASVARIVVELPGGRTIDAVVRDGVWFAGVPGNLVAPPRIRAYDAAGALLGERTGDKESLRCATTPMTKGCGSRTHWG